MKIQTPNVEYEANRNKFIPIAEALADKQMADVPRGEAETKDRDDWNNKWNKIFHSQMDLLCKDL